jgi:hypothetical protein
VPGQIGVQMHTVQVQLAHLFVLLEHRFQLLHVALGRLSSNRFQIISSACSSKCSLEPRFSAVIGLALFGLSAFGAGSEAGRVGFFKVGSVRQAALWLRVVEYNSTNGP